MSTIDAGRAPAGSSPVQWVLHWRQLWLGMDANPAVLAFAASRAGSVVVHAGFALAIAATLQFSLDFAALVMVTVVACALLPRHRLAIVAASSALFFIVRPFRTTPFADLVASVSASLPAAWSMSPGTLRTIGTVGVLLLAFAALEALRRNPSSYAGRRPLVAQLAAYGITLVAAMMQAPGTLAHAISWTVVAVWSSSFWMFAYLAADARSNAKTPNVVRAGLLRPFWGGSATPIGKNPGYLAKFEARDATELAVTRLKAVKLMVWAALLNALFLGLNAVIHDWASIPTLHESVLAHAGGAPASLGIRWTSLFATYFLDLIVIAVWGHVIVAVIRMVGYRIPRNTVNPLASRSLAEFWNRYFFYYKELLVDFFFYPAFLRWFKTNPALRLAFATFCAAGLGNFLYHAMSESHYFATLPIAETASRFATFFFYTMVLSAGLIVSQWRNKRPQPADGFWAYEVQPRLVVCLFFCFLKIFDDIFGHATLAERLHFFFSLSGVI
jgi:hypothetical protein